jgi:two-component system C4-dicarboxylate transport response regulator DctD
MDLVLSDINMPNLNGLKLLEIVQLQAAKAPVILLTSETAPEVETRAREMGAADFLRKPIARDLLLERIQAVLSAGPA